MIRVNFILGYLGSGKTTFVQSYLNAEQAKLERLLIIVNDFGKVNYDGETLRQSGSEVLDITHGCLCCDLKLRFREVLLDNKDRTDIDRIIIEPSGIMIPDFIIEMFRDSNLSSYFRLEPFIHVLDVNLFHNILGKWPPFIRRQLQMTPKVVLNSKGDSASSKVDSVIREVLANNPNAELFKFDNEAIQASGILNTKVEWDPVNIAPSTHEMLTHDFTSRFVDEALPEFVDQSEVETYLLRQGANLIRSKGRILIRCQMFFLNYIDEVVTLEEVTGSQAELPVGLVLIFRKDT